MRFYLFSTKFNSAITSQKYLLENYMYFTKIHILFKKLNICIKIDNYISNIMTVNLF